MALISTVADTADCLARCHRRPMGLTRASDSAKPPFSAVNELNSGSQKVAFGNDDPAGFHKALLVPE